MAIEYKFLDQWLSGEGEAGEASGNTPSTNVRLWGSGYSEYRFAALTRPAFTAGPQQITVYLSAVSPEGSMLLEVRRGTQVLTSRTEAVTSTYVEKPNGHPVTWTFSDPGGSTADLRLYAAPQAQAWANLHYAQLTADTTMPVVEASGRANAVSGTSAGPLRLRHVLPALGFDAVSTTRGNVWVKRPSVPPAPMWNTDGSPLEAWFTDGAPLPDPALV